MTGKTLPLYRKIYRRYLARFAFFRALKASLLRLSRPRFGSVNRTAFVSPVLRIMETIARAARSRTYQPMTWSPALAVTSVLIEEQSDLEVAPPRFVPAQPPTGTVEPSNVVLSPRLEIAEFSYRKVMGGTDLLFGKRSVIHPAFFDPEVEVCPAERFGVIEYRRDPARIIGSLKTTRRLPEAISLLAQCEGNYAHFMVEVLPKLAVLNRSGLYPGAPILMAGWTHPNLHAALQSVNRGAREVVLVDRWEVVKVARLISVSPPAYIVAEHRDHAEHGSLLGVSNERFPFSHTALAALREDILKHAIPTRSRRHSAHGRYYIRRNHAGNPRRAINADRIEKIARAYGFKPVDPGRLTFDQQVSIFRTATIVIGQVGAALVNTLFADRGCSVLALSPFFEGGNYYFWSNLMGVLGHDLNYVVGPQVESGNHTLHRNYMIDLDSFEAALRRTIANSERSPDKKIVTR